MRVTVAIVSTMDTKGREIAYLKDRIEKLGCTTLVIDVGVFAPVGISPDVSREEVAGAAGSSISEILGQGHKGAAFHTMSKGALQKISQLYAERGFDAIVSVGGGTGTHMVAGAMQALPMGVPKLMVTTVASRDVSAIVGSKDITLMHAFCDIIGLNFMTKRLLGTAAGAIVGMVSVKRAPSPDSRVVGLTSFSPVNRCARSAQEMLGAFGYEVVPFHAVGSGSMAMEALINDRVIRGVLDLSLHEFADQIHNGYCKNIGPDRLENAGHMGLPHVILPGGLDMIVFECTSPEGVPEHLRNRKFVSHDFRSLLRTNADDYIRLAAIIAEKVNRAIRPPTLVIPLKGWSTIDDEGEPFYEPETNRVFVSEIKSRLLPRVKVVEVEAHINDDACAKIVASELHDLMEHTYGSGSVSSTFGKSTDII